MTNDMELIKQLEKEIGKKLKKIKFVDIGGNENGFSIDRRGRVTGLNLDKMELESLPPVLFQFSEIRSLSLYVNKINNVDGLSRLSGLTTLDLGDNQLTTLSGLEGLSGLTTLDLSRNQLTTLSGLEGLSGLTELRVSNNKLTTLSGLEGLSGLTELYLINNKIKKIPGPILQWDIDFDLKTKEWYQAEKDGIYLYKNPIEEPPIEILKQGKEAIRAYLKSLKIDEKLQLNEVKVLLVGDGGAGKTSLMKRLMDLDFDQNESQTHGINIEKWSMDNHGDTIKINLWDFGGQEIMHATHQFFLSKRSLYVLVLDGRRDEKPEYWLKLIESFGGSSPVLVVMNKMDEHPGFKLNQRFLQEKYKNIVGFHRLSCKNNTGLSTFKKALETAVKQIEIIHTIWPERWFKVKKEMENMTEPYIPYSRYQQLCGVEKIKEKAGQSTLVEFLNDLGVIVYFKDLALKHMQVLQPRWLTGAVYKIINAQILASQNGHLDLDALEDILDGQQDEKEGECFHYPHECHNYIVKLMEKFELCYRLPGERILVPDLLDEEEPEFEFNSGEALSFVIQYDFLPRSVMPRFIVNRHKEIKESLQWRTGVVLRDEQFNSTALVKADNEARRIYIHVSGAQMRDYFAVVLATLRRINGSFEKLETRELIPMPDEPATMAEYQQLINMEKEGAEYYFTSTANKKYRVKDLLGTVAPVDQTLEEIKEILLKLVDENDTKESAARKLNNIISFQPSFLGLKPDLSKATDWLIETVLRKKKKKKS